MVGGVEVSSGGEAAMQGLPQNRGGSERGIPLVGAWGGASAEELERCQIPVATQLPTVRA